MNIKNRKARYFSIINYKKNNFIYENVLGYKTNQTNVHINGVSQKNVLDVSCACHNFTPFIGSDGLLYAIGGQDSWKNDREFYTKEMKKYKNFKEYYEKRMNREYTGSPERFSQTMRHFERLNKPLYHTKGLYLFSSKDGKKFHQVKEEPIIKADHPGFNSSLKWKSAEFDGTLSVTQWEGYYYLFARENPAPGQRFIQFSRSKDLISWESFRRPAIPFEEKVCVYFASLVKHKDYVLVFTPKHTDKKCWIDVYKTYDFISYEHVTQILRKGVFKANAGLIKNIDHSCNSNIPGKYFIHHNYLGYSTGEVTVKGYEIQKLFRK